MDTLLQDLGYAIRTLQRAPVFTAVAVVTLGLGIGANTAIFSALYGVLLRPMPYAGSDRLVELSYTFQDYHDIKPVTYPTFRYLQDNSATFDAMAAFTGLGVNLYTGSEAVHLRMERVSRDYFRVLGTAPSLGRFFVSEEDQPGGPDAVVVSDALWHRAFRADAKILGKKILIDGAPFTVIGVLPRDFRPITPNDLWTTLAQVSRTIGSGQNLQVIGRLAPGLTLAQADTRLQPVFVAYAEAFHRDTSEHLSFGSFRLLQGQGVRAPLRILFGAIAFVLLIACANVASLLLGRAASRRRELSVRASLGATRWRLVRQLLSESVLLALLGGAFGLAIATWGISLLRILAPDSLPRMGDIRIDGWAFAFTALVSLITGIGFGILPALQASGSDVSTALKESATRTTGRAGAQHILVAGEVGLALVLLIGAGLLLRTLANLMRTDSGFDTHRVVSAELWLTGTHYDTAPAIASYYDDVVRRVKAIPGVSSAAIVEAGLPLTRGGNTGIAVKGEQMKSVDYRAVTPGFFATLGIPLRQGRYLDATDRTASEPVVVVNEAYARRFLADHDPLGTTLVVAEDRLPRRVVGVVGDVTADIGLSAPPTAFIPASQEGAGTALGFNGWFPIHLLVRATRDPGAFVNSVDRTLRGVDPQVPVGRVRTMDAVLAETLTFRRFLTTLLALFAGLAAALAAVGIYGLMSYLVTQRSREFGIRMALGARAADVVAMVVRRALVLVAAGIGAGTAAASGLTRLLTNQLFGVQPIDPMTFGIVMAGVVAVALLACSVPAWRGTKVDPVVALRAE
jgi:putative ABC transport system permease protein